MSPFAEAVAPRGGFPVPPCGGRGTKAQWNGPGNTSSNIETLVIFPTPPFGEMGRKAEGDGPGNTSSNIAPNKLSWTADSRAHPS
eukprot:1545592-Pyramimonas_sp.AAC.1